MRYHKTHLTGCLILETSADSEEENMVEWLRDVGMDLNQEFKDRYKGARQVSGVQVGV